LNSHARLLRSEMFVKNVYKYIKSSDRRKNLQCVSPYLLQGVPQTVVLVITERVQISPQGASEEHRILKI
jgi:hypothetical protein